MRIVLLAFLLLQISSTELQAQLKKLAVIGSSTAAGNGSSPAIDSSWVRRVNYYYKYQNSVVDTVYNLAVPGYDPYYGLPSSYSTAQFYSVPDPEHNITKANSFSPDVVIVSFVSNLYNTGGLPMDSIMHALQVIKDSANKEGHVCFITTSQPRTSFDAPSRERLRIIKDSIINRFGFYSINFFDSIVNPIDNTILLQYSAGDNIHLNNAGHALLYRQVLAKNIFTITTTRTRKSGDFNDPLTWDKGLVPGPQDSIAVLSGHTLTCNGNFMVRALSVASGGNVVINNASARLQVGQSSQSNHDLINNGSLSLSNGQFVIYGRWKQAAGSSFVMNGGELIIDGNNGNEETSVANNLHLFDIDAASSFSFTAGTLQIIDPPFGNNSQSVNCGFNFGVNSVLKFGNGVSATVSNNINGFGGSLLPAQIGKLIIDAASSSNNRHFKNVNPLTIKKSIDVLSGNLIQGAAINLEN